MSTDQETGKWGTAVVSVAIERRLRDRLGPIADELIAAIIAEVPSYSRALAGPMGDTIRGAVQLALGSFLDVATKDRVEGQLLTLGRVNEASYGLGRGEARSGRSIDALLAAYRVGARVSWREFSASALDAGMTSASIAAMAGLIFAYIDELSAAAAAGHAFETARAGRARLHELERLTRALLEGNAEDVVQQAANRADWKPPATLTAVLVDQRMARWVVANLDQNTLLLSDEIPDNPPEGLAVLLVPDAHGANRPQLLRSLARHGAVVGPARDWLAVRSSFRRALQAVAVGLWTEGSAPVDTDEHLAAIVLTADPEARADLRARVLAPMADLRPAVAEKLTETLRAWLLHHGRRDEVAASLFVHPQTVRYRVGQLRELFGNSLDDPQMVLELTVALG